ncbi:hypothetical protein [Halomicrococcus gelatinilyticus]|uniref:hypothetical protein n=1 Tax=Halomicrococcus gelatinilyticus TaxID=1702103 RepID=UPI002E0F32BA
MGSEIVALSITLLTAVLFVGVALHSLRPDSPLRRLYDVDPDDDAAVRSNALVVGLSGVLLGLLGAAVVADVPERVVGAGTVLVAAALCIVLGWFIRCRDRRELLTSPDVDRDTARRVGGAAILCGVLALPLAPAIWVDAGPAVVLAIAAGGFVATTLAIGLAYR